MLAGAPLPRKSTPVRQPANNLFNIKKNYYFPKRTQEQMMRNGDYTLDNYRPLKPCIDRTKEKETLQEIMEFGQKVQPKRIEKFVPNTASVLLTRETRTNELAEEINERMNFLDDMRDYGQGKRYEQAMKQEIAVKLLELKRVQRMTDDEFRALAIAK